jgi:hypothetical protein
MGDNQIRIVNGDRQYPGKIVCLQHHVLRVTPLNEGRNTVYGIRFDIKGSQVHVTTEIPEGTEIETTNERTIDIAANSVQCRLTAIIEEDEDSPFSIRFKSFPYVELILMNTDEVSEGEPLQELLGIDRLKVV